MTSTAVHPELVEGLLKRSHEWFDKLTTNGMGAINVALCSLLIPALSFAQQGKFADPNSVPAPVSGASSISYVTLALVVVLAMVYGAAWMVRRLKTFHRGAQQNLDVIEAIPVGPKERAVLVRVKDRQVLLGVSAGRVNLLLDLGPQAEESKPPTSGDDSSNPSTANAPNFKALLKRSMGLS